ncbi:MAG: prolyl oligopeptidase family serine peptidase [Acidobacteria bacterium]|nr:prolyl oligopeptidase family serine peptidase [Acidobacteriota bacterium]
MPVRGRPEHDERRLAAAHGRRASTRSGETRRRRTSTSTSKRYCPYTNLKKGAYPAMLVKTSFNDGQVFHHEPAKYVARLRARSRRTRNRSLLQTNMAAGHGGASGRYDFPHEIALDGGVPADAVRHRGIDGPVSGNDHARTSRVIPPCSSGSDSPPAS